MGNVFTSAGKAAATAALVAASAMKFLQWGVSSGQISTSNALASTSGTTEGRTSGTMSQVTTTVTNDTLQVTGTITAAGSRAITEVGVFDIAGTGSPPTGGNMDLYGDFTAINLSASDSIAFTIKLTFA